MSKQRKRLLALTSALMFGTSQLVTLGVVTHSAPAAAETGSITISGTYTPVDPWDAGNGDPWGNGGNDGSGDGSGSGDNGAGVNTSKDPNGKAKDCAENRIQDFAGSNSGVLPRKLDDVLANVPANKTPIPANLAKASFDKQNGLGSWDKLTATEQKYYSSIPRSFIYSSNNSSIYVPSDANGQPSVLSDPALRQIWEANVGSLGNYGATWNGMLNSMGLTQLASALSPEDAKEFVFQHEVAHVESPFHTDHPNIRNEQSLFDSATGNPKTADGLALMNMAAIKSNAPAGDTYNKELEKLAKAARIPNVSNAKSPEADC
jgi:hypothetical protein